MRTIAGILVYILLISGCKQDAPDALSVSNAYAYAPLSESGPGVAYFTLNNGGASEVRVHSFSSNCFSKAELHRSVIENNVSRMLPVEYLVIDVDSSVRLSPNGLHLMLMMPDDSVKPGKRCAVQILFDDNQALTFDVEMLDRSKYRPGEPVK